MKINKKDILAAIGAVVVCQMAGMVGSLFTASAIPGWYSTLQKSSLNPPGWVFGPVWLLLYTMMGLAAFLVWKRNRKQKLQVRGALFLFGVQLFLNALWSFLFFGEHQIFAALVDLSLLWVLVACTAALFGRISRPAFWLLVPYLLWLSFAWYLNFSVWQLN